MAFPALAHAAVKPRTDGNTVLYDLFSGSDSATPLKSTRFKELDRLRADVAKENLVFSGKLPGKTLGRRTNPAFIANRRADIKQHFLVAARNVRFMSSDSFKRFFGDAPTSTADTEDDFEVWAVPLRAEVEPPVVQTEAPTMSDIGTLDKEFRQLLTKVNVFQLAASAKSDVQVSVTSGDTQLHAKKEAAGQERVAEALLSKHLDKRSAQAVAELNAAITGWERKNLVEQIGAVIAR